MGVPLGYTDEGWIVISYCKAAVNDIRVGALLPGRCAGYMREGNCVISGADVGREVNSGRMWA